MTERTDIDADLGGDPPCWAHLFDDDADGECTSPEPPCHTAADPVDSACDGTQTRNE